MSSAVSTLTQTHLKKVFSHVMEHANSFLNLLFTRFPINMTIDCDLDLSKLTYFSLSKTIFTLFFFKKEQLKLHPKACCSQNFHDV